MCDGVDRIVCYYVVGCVLVVGDCDQFGYWYGDGVLVAELVC